MPSTKKTIKKEKVITVRTGYKFDTDRAIRIAQQINKLYVEEQHDQCNVCTEPRSN